MNISDQVLIIQNPDGTIQIGTQPHLKNKKVMDCYKCRSKIIFDGQYTTLQCSNCKTLNQVPGSQIQQPETITCALCHGQARIIPHNEMRFAHCQRCGAVTGMM